MVSFRSAEKQAKYAVRLKTAIGTPRHGNKNDGKVHSLGTERNYRVALVGLAKFMELYRLGTDLRDLNMDIAVRYLEERSQEVMQKTLNLDRQAMQSQLGARIPVVKSELDAAMCSRAYTHDQCLLVARAQSERHSLATMLIKSAGLRAHELLTLKPIPERARDTHRQYRNDLFAGRDLADYPRYSVEGKGGLVREVAIDLVLADQLELLRLEEPKVVYDRDIRYLQSYGIGGGKQWSDSFGKASTRALGWSHGGHGLRHSYAQQRMNTLQAMGYLYNDALAVVSQEMGHFRPGITKVYLR